MNVILISLIFLCFHSQVYSETVLNDQEIVTDNDGLVIQTPKLALSGVPFSILVKLPYYYQGNEN